MGWKMFGNVTLRDDGPFERNPHYVRLAWAGHNDMWTGIQNEGFFGIGLKAGDDYRFSVWARVPDGKPVTLLVQFIDQNTMENRQAFVSQDLTIDSREWKKYTLVMRSPRTIEKPTCAFSSPTRNTVRAQVPSTWSMSRSSRQIPGWGMRTACARTSHRHSSTCIPASSVSPEDASSKAVTSPHATSGRTPWDR